ncbi:MAG: hypothetical protein ACRDMZ_10945, partial [Solirubrobacteraceae bacterium]
MRLILAAGVLLFTLLLAGCSSHEAKFDGTAPPRLPALDSVRLTTDRLIARPAPAIVSLPADALAALTQAAALHAETTGGAGLRTLTTRYADALLRARIHAGGDSGLPAGARADRIDPGTTLRAGLALAEAYRVTRTARYAAAVRGLARTVSTPPFGLLALRRGLVMRETQPGRRRSIALTALAAAFMTAADPFDGRRLRTYASGALRTVADQQPAVGRWYAYVGTRQPMSLEQWGTTLAALARVPADEAQSIVATGVAAMNENAFLADGVVRAGALTVEPKGIAIALRALASGPR